MSTVSLVRLSPSNALQECPNCGFITWYLPANLGPNESNRINDRVEHRRPIKRSGYVQHAGSALTSLYVINSGFLKTIMNDGDGREQITGFFMRGELVGMDALGTGKHQCDTVAIEDSHVCGMRYSDFEELSCAIPALQRHFHRAMSAEIVRNHGIMLLLAAMRAEERVAVFLLNLSKRFSARGYSGTRFRLPMSRQEIGNYLGLNLETVSRAFSHFNGLELTATNGRDVEIRSLLKLRQTIGDPATRLR